MEFPFPVRAKLDTHRPAGRRNDVLFDVDVEVAEALRAQDNLARIRGIDAPLLVVTGENDRVTDAEMGRRLYEAASSSYRKLVEVEGGSHNDLYEEAEVRSAYRNLIDRIAGN